MILRPGGMDLFYIDESHDTKLFAVTAVTIPFLRNVRGMWHIVWPDHLAAAKDWRRTISEQVKIPIKKELHGTKLASGRGNYLYGGRNFSKEQSLDAYCKVLRLISHLEDASVITAVGERGHGLYGEERLTRVMTALFQRMRMQCVSRRVNAMVFFDQGHPEYRALYRKSKVQLTTGSQFGSARNLPLDMFVKDGNEKSSAHCLFTQTADLIAFAAFSKARNERGMFTDERSLRALSQLYDQVPQRVVNQKASPQRDGIVRLQ